MKRILVNLISCEENQCKTFIDALRFLPVRPEIQFILVGKYEYPDFIKHLAQCIDCCNHFQFEWHQESYFTAHLYEKYHADAMINYMCNESVNMQTPGFNQIITPVMDVYYFAHNDKNLFDLSEENLLAISLNQLVNHLKEEKIESIDFLRSQLFMYTEIEDNMIELLKRDFILKEIYLADLRDVSDISSHQIVTLFPHIILSLIKLFLPTSIADINHRYNIPCLEIKNSENDTFIVKQHIRYCTNQLFHILSFNQSDPKTYAYKSFAYLYDHYMDHVTYQKWVDFVIYQYKSLYKQKPKVIADIACGTGTISNILADQDYHVISSDKSPEMLDVAIGKNNNLHLFQADMTDFDLSVKADLILLLFDSINYLTEREHVLKLFECIKRNLNPSSMFIFDISTLYNSNEHFDGFINLEEYKEMFFVHRADYLSHKKRQENLLNIFTSTFLGYRREDEVHQQRVWRAKELQDMIKEAKMKLCGLYSIDEPQNMVKENPNSLDTKYARLSFIVSNEE